MKATLRSLMGLTGTSMLLFGAGLTAHAQDAKPADAAKTADAKPDAAPVTMTHTPKAGTTIRFKMTQKATLGGMDVTVKQETHENVKEVKKDGSEVIEIVGDGGSYELMGESHDIPASPPTTVTLDKTGKLTDYKADTPAQALMAPELTRLLLETSTFILPSKPVKVNDTWETTIDNVAVKGKKVTLKDTYTGTEKVGGVSLWKVKRTADADTDDSGAKMTSETTFWIDPADGHIVKSEGKRTGIPTQFGSMDATTTTEFVKMEPTKTDKPTAEAK